MLRVHPYSGSSEQRLRRGTDHTTSLSTLQNFCMPAANPSRVPLPALPTSAPAIPLIGQPQILGTNIITPMAGTTANIPQGTAKLMLLKPLKASGANREIYVLNAGKDYALACMLQNGPLKYPQWSDALQYGGQQLSAINVAEARWWEQSSTYQYYSLRFILIPDCTDMKRRNGMDGSYSLIYSLVQSARHNSLVHVEGFLSRMTRQQRSRLFRKSATNSHIDIDESLAPGRPVYGIHTGLILSHACLVDNELTSKNLLQDDNFLHFFQVSYSDFLLLFITKLISGPARKIHQPRL